MALIIVGVALFILALTDKLPLEGLIFSPLGAIGLFVFIFAFVFMALAQLRHAIWDMGKMLEPNKNNSLSYVMIVVSVVAAAIATFIATGAF